MPPRANRAYGRPPTLRQPRSFCWFANTPIRSNDWTALPQGKSSWTACTPFDGWIYGSAPNR